MYKTMKMTVMLLAFVSLFLTDVSGQTQTGDPETPACKPVDETPQNEDDTWDITRVEMIPEARVIEVSYQVTKNVPEVYVKQITYTVLKPVYEAGQNDDTAWDITRIKMVPETRVKEVSYVVMRKMTETRVKQIPYSVLLPEKMR